MNQISNMKEIESVNINALTEWQLNQQYSPQI